MIDECHLVWGDVCGYVWGKTNIRIEVPITRDREKQTYYGALDYRTKEFVIKAYPTGNSANTIKFLKYLQQQRPGRKLSVIWDGASYHRSADLRAYLDTINRSLPPAQWKITCMRFAPYAPEQNPVEDIWLHAKCYLREHYHRCTSFKMVKALFMKVTKHQFFDFPKIHMYG